MNEVEEVLAAEKEAANILAKSERDCQKMLEEARNSVVQEIAKEQEKNIAWQNEQVAKKKEALEKEKKDILEKAKEQAIKFEKKADEKIDSSVKKLMKSFEGLTE